MNEIQLYSKINEQIDAIERLGKIWARSGCFRCTREEQGTMILTVCISMGITPTEFLATYDLIDGVPRKKALACLADFRKRGGRHKWLTEPDDKEKATGEFTIEGQTYKVTFTIEDAKLQGLVRPNSNWVKTPSNMLRARCITNAIGMLAPEIVAGTDADDDALVPTASALNLASLPGASQPTQIAGTSQAKQLGAPRVTATPSEEKELASMGLAPATPTLEPAVVDPSPNTLVIPAGAKTIGPAVAAPAKKTKFPAALDPLEPDEEPMPPPTTIEPEQPQPEPEPKPSKVPTARAELPPDIVEEIGRIFQGHYVEVAAWLVKEGWIPPSDKPINTEAFAAIYLQRTLPFLTKPRAKKILAQKMAFMRAVEEIKL